MSIVYIPNHAGHDYTAANKFGDVKVITTGRLEKYKLHEFYTLCEEELKEANEDDYILLSGLSSVCVIACSILSHRFGRLNILVYKGDRYVKYNFNFNEEGRGEGESDQP